MDRQVVVIAARDEATIKVLLPGYWERSSDSRPGGVLATAADRHYIVVRTDVRASDDANMNPHRAWRWRACCGGYPGGTRRAAMPSRRESLLNTDQERNNVQQLLDLFDRASAPAK